MNPNPKTLRASVLAAFAAGCFLPTNLPAGESIQFSNARNRVDPTAKSKLPGGKESGAGMVNPIDLVPHVSNQGRQDPIRNRKDKNAAAERANWMVLDRGQLDAEDEQKRAFGVREEGFEKEPDEKDYFFKPREPKAGLPGNNRTAYGTDRSQPAAPQETAPGVPKEQNGSDTRRTETLGKDGKPVGEHTAKELDMTDLLSPGKANSLAPTMDKNTMMWREVFGGGESRSDASRRRNESETRAAESFGGSWSTPGAGSSSDTFGTRTEFGSRPAGFSSPSLPASSARNIASPSVPIAPRAADQGFRQASGLYGAPSANDAFNSRGAGLNSSPDPTHGRPPSSSSPRSTSGSFQIPTRPGYGGR